MSSSAFLLPKARPTGATSAQCQSEVARSPTSDAASSSPKPPLEPRTYIRLPAVRDLTGLPTSTIYRYVKHHQFPLPHELGPRTVGWLQSDVDLWLAARQPRQPRARR